ARLGLGAHVLLLSTFGIAPAIMRHRGCSLLARVAQATRARSRVRTLGRALSSAADASARRSHACARALPRAVRRAVRAWTGGAGASAGGAGGADAYEDRCRHPARMWPRGSGRPPIARA